MSTAPEGWTIPRWDVSDRLRKSMRTARLSVQDMADYFDVHRNTVGGWLHGRINPDTRTLRLWAFRTSVPYEWIRDGDGGPPSLPGEPLPPIDQPVGVSIMAGQAA